MFTESSSSENDTDNIENEEAINVEERESQLNEDDSNFDTNAGWADSVAKILRTKRTKGKKTLVLSKAKKLTDVVIREKAVKIGFQIDGEVKEEKPDIEALDVKTEVVEPTRKKRKEISSIRVKPHVLEKDRERILSKIATRGVVQLFNAVSGQQNKICTELEKAGPLERKREDVMKKMDKRAFLDVLMRKKSQQVDGVVKEEKSNATWSVLRDDFMMGAKLKDWNKEKEEDDDECVDNLSDSD